MTEASERQKLPGRVYYVSCPEDNTVEVAMDVRIAGDTVSWFDTIKERLMKIERIINDSHPDYFIFKRNVEEGGGVYTFVPMTLQLYNERVKRHLLAPKDFTDIEQLLKEFEDTKNYAW
jgi:hypothetical protein